MLVEINLGLWLYMNVHNSPSRVFLPWILIVTLLHIHVRISVHGHVFAGVWPKTGNYNLYMWLQSMNTWSRADTKEVKWLFPASMWCLSCHVSWYSPFTCTRIHHLCQAISRYDHQSTYELTADVQLWIHEYLKQPQAIDIFFSVILEVWLNIYS